MSNVLCSVLATIVIVGQLSQATALEPGTVVGPVKLTALSGDEITMDNYAERPARPCSSCRVDLRPPRRDRRHQRAPPEVPIAESPLRGGLLRSGGGTRRYSLVRTALRLHISCL